MVLSDWLPTLFRANGLCDAPYPPIFGLAIPEWALVWFVIFILMFIWAFFQPAPRSMFHERL
jgi:disulfide bond formation protein DsbB